MKAILKGSEGLNAFKNILFRCNRIEFDYNQKQEIKEKYSSGYFLDGEFYIAFRIDEDGNISIKKLKREETAIAWCNGKTIDEEGKIKYYFYQDEQVQLTRRMYFSMYAFNEYEAIERIKEFERDSLENTDMSEFSIDETDYMYNTSSIIESREIEIYSNNYIDINDEPKLITTIPIKSEVKQKISEIACELAEFHLMKQYGLDYEELFITSEDGRKYKDEYQDQFNFLYDGYEKKLLSI